MDVDLFELELEVENKEEVFKYLEGLNKNVRAKRLETTWENILELVLGSIKDYAPHWEGGISSNLASELSIEKEILSGIVFTDRRYAPYMERGVNPFFPNLDAITPWAEDHGFDPYCLALIIASRGLPALKFFEQGFMDVKDEVLNLVGDILVQIIEGDSNA